MEVGPGTTLGAYTIVEQLGRGGMAAVYKAYHAQLDRYVAIKVVLPMISQDPVFRERFAREARTVARLHHPNILAIYDYSEEQSLAYIVTELMLGGSLVGRLGEPLRPLEAARLIEPLAAALDYAHGHGVIHRDVKPSNILLHTDGTPVLADFGIAKLAGAGEHLTQSRLVMGTPAYQAPEQAQGEPASRATDQYALGIVAYQLLTGRVPFSAETPMAVLLAHLVKPLPPPRSINPALTEEVERVLLTVLAKDPKDRYPGVSAFARALAQAAGGQTPIPPSPPPSGEPAVAAPTVLVPDPPPTPDVAPGLRPTAVADGPPEAGAFLPAGRATMLAPDGPPRWGATRPMRNGGLTAAALAALVLVLALVAAVRGSAGGRSGAATIAPTAVPSARAVAAATVPVVEALDLIAPSPTAPAAVATATPAGGDAQTTSAAGASSPAPSPGGSQGPSDAWDATLAGLDPVWGTDWPRAIALLDAYRAGNPGSPDADRKLYAALVAYGIGLAQAGDTAGAAAQFSRAQSILPERPEAAAALAALTSTPAADQPQLASPLASSGTTAAPQPTAPPAGAARTPKISLDVEPQVVAPGGKVSVTWLVTNVDPGAQIMLLPGPGNVGAVGSYTATITAATQFTLTAANRGGSPSESVVSVAVARPTEVPTSTPPPPAASTPTWTPTAVPTASPTAQSSPSGQHGNPSPTHTPTPTRKATPTSTTSPTPNAPTAIPTLSPTPSPSRVIVRPPGGIITRLTPGSAAFP